MKIYDKNSLLFARAAIIGLQAGGPMLIADMALTACREAAEKAGEAINPVALLPLLHPTEAYELMTNGALNYHEGLATKEECKAEVEAFIKQDARQAITTYLSKRVTA